MQHDKGGFQYKYLPYLILQTSDIVSLLNHPPPQKKKFTHQFYFPTTWYEGV